jgi:hypothetical protein
MSNQSFSFYVPKQAVGANLVYFDLWNGSNDKTLEVHSIQPVVSGAVAVTGVLGIDLFLTFTSTIGTGGTAAANNETDITKGSITVLRKNNPVINPKITLRLTPSGGATAGAVIAMRSVFPEETNAASYLVKDFIQHLQYQESQLYIEPGRGIRVVQGAVASVGNIAFNGTFHYS